MPQAEWHGSKDAWKDLLAAAHNHCTCDPDDPRDECPVHQMLLQNQRALDGLPFGRHLRARLQREEGLTNETEGIDP